MKTTNKMLRIIILLLPVIFIFSCQSKNKVKPGTTNQTDTAKVFTYTFDVQKEISAESAGRIAAEIMDAGNLKLMVNDQKIAYYSSPDDASVYFEQDLNTGNLSFSKSMRKYYGKAVPKLPTADEADKLAREYLKKFNLLPAKEEELKLVHKGGLRASSVIDGKKGGPVIDKMVTLTYARFIDGVPVIGPGSKMLVNIGNEGEITGAIKRWREINMSSKTQAKPEEVFTQKEAETELQKLMATEFGREATYEVKSSSKAYYDGNGTTLQPVFVFETKVSLGKENVAPFDYLALVNVLKNPAESVRPIIDERAIRNVKAAKDVKPTRPLDKED
ncbi:MAG: hypothetical protein WCI92_16935 [Bacteroidota bacterium]